MYDYQCCAAVLFIQQADLERKYALTNMRRPNNNYILKVFI